MLNKSIALQNFCLSLLFTQRKKQTKQVKSFSGFFCEYWSWHTITFCGMPITTHLSKPTQMHHHAVISIKQVQNWPQSVTVGGYLFQVLKITPILNSDLQPINNSQLNSFQTQFNCTSLFQIHTCSHHNSFHGISWLGVHKTSSHLLGSPKSTDPRPMSSILHKNVGISWSLS